MSKLVRRSIETLASRPLDSQEVRLRPAPFWTHALEITIIATAVAGFGFAVVAKIDEVVVAPGVLQPVGAERPIKSPLAGVAAEILVKEGEEVQIGQPLLRLSSEISRKRGTTVQEQSGMEKQRLNEQSQAMQARERSSSARVDALVQALVVEKKILDQISPLAASGAMSQMQLLQQQNRVAQLRSEVAQAEANLKQIQVESVRFRQDSLRSLSDLDRERVEVEEIQKREILRAPVAGVVFDLVPSSPGYTVSQGETLLKVVPQNPLEAKVFFTDREIGFVKAGQSAEVRVNAFPFTQFGSIPGTIKSVSRFSLPADQKNPQRRFPGYVALERNYLLRQGDTFPVGTGQGVSVNVMLREKRVITLLTDAFGRAFDALRQIRSTSN